MSTKFQVSRNIDAKSDRLADEKVGEKLVKLSYLIKEIPEEKPDLTTMTIGQLKRYWKKKDKNPKEQPSNWMKRRITR